MATAKQVQDFLALYNKANAVGAAGAAATTPRPMDVSWYDKDDGSVQSEHVADGVCGFAWVTVKPGTSAFAKWLVKQDLASKAYGGGVMIWIGAYNQSMQKKQAHAHAMAVALNAGGVNAYAGSRID